MKKVIIVLALALTSCTKSWICTIETTSVLGTSYHEYNLKGTTQEKNEFEADGTQYLNSAGGINQVTTCVIE